MRQKPTRIFANQPIPTCSGFTCMGCLKRPRGPSGTCHSKAKVPRASIPLNAATSESAHISGIQFLLVLSHSWCHVFFSKGPFVLLELGLFICSYNKQEMYLGSYHNSAEPRKCSRWRFSGKKTRGEGFNKGKTFCLPELIESIFWVFCGWKKNHFSGWCISNEFLTTKILTSWFSSDLWMFKKRWVTFPVSNII